VALDSASSADDGMRADAHKMMNWTERANVGPVFDGDVSAERGCVSHDDVTADLAIVRDVCIGHDQVAVANSCAASAFERAAIDGDVLPNLVAVADFQTRGLACVGQILRSHADCSKGKEAIIFAYLRRSLDRDVRDQMASFADFDAGADYAVRADLAGRMNLRVRVDDGCGVDGHSTQRSAVSKSTWQLAIGIWS